MNDLKTVRILIVDDDRASAFILEKLMLSSGHNIEIYVSRNGLDAIEKLTGLKIPMPDVIVADLNMPIMDGFQFIIELTGSDFYKRTKIPIAIQTSSLEKSDRMMARSLDILNYFIKPLRREDVETIVMMALK